MEATRGGSAYVQMNTRIGKDLKRRGDAALAKAGFTPSRAVRALWEFASKHEDDPEAIERYLGQGEGRHGADELARAEGRRAAVDGGLRIVADGLEEIGLASLTAPAASARQSASAAHPPTAEPAAKELLADALFERFGKRG